MSEYDKSYFARRAADEAELAQATEDPHAQAAHRRLQRAYIDRASVGDGPGLAEQKTALSIFFIRACSTGSGPASAGC